MKPVLYSMAVLNVVLLAACGWLILAPAGGWRAAATDLPRAHSAEDAGGSFAPAGALAEQRSRALFQAPAISRAALQANPAPRAGTSRVIVNASVSGEIAPSSFDQEIKVSSAGAGDDSPAVSSEPVTRQAASGTSTAPAVNRPTFLNPVAPYAPGSTTNNNEPQAVAVPVAFTTSAEGATPSQAAALGRLQGDFASDVGQNQNPYAPAYAQNWQAAQSQSDSNFAQQFGWQAFVRAQLAQVHGGSN